MPVISALLALAVAGSTPIDAEQFVGRYYTDLITADRYYSVAGNAMPDSMRAVFDDADDVEMPGRAASVIGHRLIIFETCKAHACNTDHNLIVIDRDTRAVYAENWKLANRTVFTPDSPVRKWVRNLCSHGACHRAK